MRSQSEATGGEPRAVGSPPQETCGETTCVAGAQSPSRSAPASSCMEDSPKYPREKANARQLSDQLIGDAKRSRCTRAALQISPAPTSRPEVARQLAPHRDRRIAHDQRARPQQRGGPFSSSSSGDVPLPDDASRSSAVRRRGRAGANGCGSAATPARQIVHPSRLR